MNQNKLFQITRIRLALWYAVVMGLILSLCGFGFYKAVFHAHVVALDNEIESIAGTLHNSIEPELKQPEILSASVIQLFPTLNICGQNECVQKKPDYQRHLVSIISDKGNYYIRFFDISGRLVAYSGVHPEDLSKDFNKQTWQFVKDNQDKTYHQITIALHTRNYQDWGYIQVGRSLSEFNSYLDTVKLTLGLGLPIALLLIAFASWWLSGLAMQPIYRSYHQIQQFTADAAHELRTPLAATNAMVESALLSPQLDAEETRDIFLSLHRQNQRLITLVGDLLLLARFDKQLPLRSEQCCLNEVVEDLVEEFAAMAIAAGVILKCYIQGNQSVVIVCDIDQIYRLVSNLIVNAIKYTPKEGEVTVLLSSNDNYAIIKVEDTGIGISAKELTHIFDRFYRVNSERSSTGGSGLGLAIAIAIVQAHQGKLNVQSQPNQGSTFIVELPLNHRSHLRINYQK